MALLLLAVAATWEKPQYIVVGEFLTQFATCGQEFNLQDAEDNTLMQIPMKRSLFPVGQITGSHLGCLWASSTVRFFLFFPWCVHYVTFNSQCQTRKWCQRGQKSGISMLPEAWRSGTQRGFAWRFLARDLYLQIHLAVNIVCTECDFFSSFPLCISYPN